MSEKAASARNYVIGYAGFLRRWQSREEEQSPALRITTGLDGNINFTGESDCCSSHLLTRSHPSFLESLEPGVKDLVKRLIETWDCITYSSCEGHPGSKGEPMRIRNVRMGTRSRQEHATLLSRLDHLCDDVNSSLGSAGIVLRCREAQLELEEGFEAPSLDLLFSPTSEDETVYWRDIDTVYAQTIFAIDRVDRDLADKAMKQRGGA